MTEARVAMRIALSKIRNEDVLCKSQNTLQMASDTVITDPSLHFQRGFDLHIIDSSLEYDLKYGSN